MQAETMMLTPQEQRIENRWEEVLTTEDAAEVRSRINRMLKDIRKHPPRIAIERACLFTESFKQTEGLPIVLRWAKALEAILHHHRVYIGDDDLIVGRCGPPGRYGIFYPEIRGTWFENGLETLPERQEGKFIFTDEDADTIRSKIIPYWKGRTLFETHFNLLPDDTKRLLYDKTDPYSQSYVMIETSTERHSLQWVLDFEKVLKIGFNGIKKQAQAKLAALDPYDTGTAYDKYPFLQAVVIICDAMEVYAKRHAELARKTAEKTGDETRKRELLDIADICEWVPGNPARTFREALQAQWFTQVVFRFEQFLGGGVGNGRIDQYLYPFYRKDVYEGRLSDDDVIELLENLWLNMAQAVTFRQSGVAAHREGLPHFEATTIGGQLTNGQDATNELSYLVLKSKKEFPLDFPDLAARIHSRTPERFLSAVCELIKEGTGFPKLFNDEEIIPSFLSKGADLEEARDYAVSGCTEVRMINRDTYLTGNAQVNLGAVVEMVLNRGKMKSKGKDRIGLKTKDPKKFKSFEDVMDAFKAQVEHLTRHAFIQNQIIDMLRPQILAAPLTSCLHDRCMENFRDIQEGKIDGAMVLGSWDPVGFGTAIDSLAAVKKLVFDDKSVKMDELLKGLETDFEGHEVLRQKCLNAPKYGNNDPYADDIGQGLENFFRAISHRYTNLYQGKLDTRYVPVTAHIPFGRVVGATPNGRRTGEALSDGISPSQGADTQGPTATLLSVARTKESTYKEGAARLFNMKLSPQAVAGDLGTRRLAELIRTWCDLKIWHIQFNIINADTLRAALKDPEKYRNLLVRVAGYSAYFVDLSPELKQEIIMRSEKGFL